MGPARLGPARLLDVLVVSLGSTHGLRVADEQLAEALAGAGASVEIASATPPRPTRTMMLTDLGWARAARAAAQRALERIEPRAIVYSSTTAALLWPRAGAIRFDASCAGNRPGRDGLWQRPLERRRLAQAPLLLPWSAAALAELPAGLARGARPTLVVPVAVEPSGPPATERDIAAITYAANPAKKGLGRVLAAWRAVPREIRGSGELHVAGVGERELRAAGLVAGAGVRIHGSLAREDYRALLRRARVFVCAPRREDYGIAQLEALVDGCQLVSTPAPGPYAALAIARELDPRLVGEQLDSGLCAALSQPRGDYAERALAALAPYRLGAVEELVRDRLPALLLGERPQL